MSEASFGRPGEVRIEIDGQDFCAPDGVTILKAVDLLNAENRSRSADSKAIEIPVLCHHPDQSPVGVCRVCVVQLEQKSKNGSNKYAGKPYFAACVRKLNKEDHGLKIHSEAPHVLAARKGVLELLMADHHAPCDRKTCELEQLARKYDAGASRYFHRELTRSHDGSSPVILVNHESCILCDRCVRACESAGHFVIARRGKGHDTEIAFDLGKPMGSSSCVSCGQCMFACPTGALTATGEAADLKPIEPHDGCVTECLTLDELLDLKAAGVRLFDYVPEEFLKLNQSSVAKVTVPPGQTLFEEAEKGDTAFCILQGKIQLSIASDLAHIATVPHPNLIGKMESKLEVEPTEERRSYVSIDAPLELAHDNPTTTLDEGRLFGEMSCMNSYPRGVTASAGENKCVLLEMRRNILDMLRKNKNLAKKIDDDYRTEALHLHLRAIFPSLSPEFLIELRSRVWLQRFSSGEVIYRQGEAGEAFYIVRAGFVKVSVHHSDRDIVVAYLAKGSHFGERALLRHMKHSATCTAEDSVDLVRIGAEDFIKMVKQCDGLEEEMNRHIEHHDRENAARIQQAFYTPGDELSLFGEQGLEQAQDMLVLDLTRCTRCDECVTACADAHDGVTRLVRDGRRFGNYLVATACRHCQDPVCMVGCPVSAIHRATSLEVKIEDWCIGCGRCAENCPYGNINMHTLPTRGKKAAVRKATNCNLCGGQEEPSCVYACPHDAAHRVTAAQFQELVKK